MTIVAVFRGSYAYGQRDIARPLELLEPFVASAAERGRLARQVWLDYFSPEKDK